MARAPKKTNGTWISGTVIRGDGRGKQLGFPTANLQLNVPSQRPAPGIYAAWARTLPDTVQHKAVVHVGPRPTFNQSGTTVEVYLVDFPDRSLYGSSLMFRSVKRLRGVKKFTSPQALTAAMKEDVQKSLAILRE